jgi:hypothetical protein
MQARGLESGVASSWHYRQMIGNSGAAPSAFDQNESAKLGDYDSWESREALEVFRLLREANLRMFTKLTPEQWLRFGIYSERGRLSRHVGINVVADIGLCPDGEPFTVNHGEAKRECRRSRCRIQSVLVTDSAALGIRRQLSMI